jgi:hypothetical protein
MKLTFSELYKATDLFSKDEQSLSIEFLHNYAEYEPNDDGFDGNKSVDNWSEYETLDFFSGLMDWGELAKRKNLTPRQAAECLFSINPFAGRSDMRNKYQGEIDFHEQYLADESQKWNLAQLVEKFGEDNLNVRMVAAVKTIKVPMKAKRKSINEQRDEFYSDWLVKENITPEETAKFTKIELRNILMNCEKAKTGKSVLWSASIDGWVKYTKLYNGINGRKKRN